MLGKRRPPSAAKSKREKAAKQSTWLTRITAAIDANASFVRRFAVVMIIILVLNPLALILIRSAIAPTDPDTFCEEFVLDVNGELECTTDKANSMVFLPEIMVSGRKCKGALNRHFYNAPIITIWTSNSHDLSRNGV